jgi:hypothetical protein
MSADLVRRAFPGARAVWLAALLAVLFAAVGFGKTLLKQELPLTGTNSVDVGAVVGRTDADKVTCVRNLVVPPNTGRMQLWLGVQQPTVERPLLTGKLTAANGRVWHVSTPLTNDGYGHFVDLDLTPASTGSAEAAGTFCFRARGAALDLGGSSINAFPGAKPTTIAGQPLPSTDLAVHFLTATRSDGRLYTRIDDALQRAALFKGLIGGAATLWVLLLAVALAVPYCVVRTAATVERHSVRTLALRATAVAAFAGIAWALMLSPLHGADEAEHVAYAQHVAETGHRADSSAGPRPAYSSDEQQLMGAVRHSSTVLNDSSRVRWDTLSQRQYERLVGKTPPRDDGGGFTDSASGHSPLYYSLVAIPYKVFAGSMNLAELDVVMRVFTALLASLIAGLAVWCASLVLTGRPAMWWLAGMLVALQPVFNSISGTVNNDTLVSLLAAISVTLVVQAWRRGPEVGPMAGLGVATLLLPVAKITGFALWPVIGVGLLIVLATHRRRDAWLRVAAVPAAAGVALLVWVFVVAPLVGGGRGALLNAHPGAPTAASNVTAAPGLTHLDQLSYLVQMFAPFIHLTSDAWSQKWPLYSVYVERGYGRFGWLDAGLAFRVLQVVTVALIVGWGMAFVAAARRIRTWRQWAPGAAILALGVASVMTFVAVAYATNSPRAVPGEQGRYIFPALVPLAVLMSGGLDVVPGRARAWAVGLTAGALPLFGLYAWLAALTDYYT